MYFFKFYALPEYFVLAKSKYCPTRFGHSKPVITQYPKQSAEFVIPYHVKLKKKDY